MFRCTTIFLIFLSLSIIGLSEVQAKYVCDTLPVKHITNGELDDWDPASFDIHEASGIRFATENDQEKLYVAMYILNPSIQKRICYTGMQLMIDAKGKKRESTYIEFPIKKDPSFALAGDDVQDQYQSYTQRLAASMLFLKKRGFKDQSQEIELEPVGTSSDIALSFAWDERNILFIEYEIPLKRLAVPENFSGKEMMVGFKLNALESQPDQPKPVTKVGSFDAKLVAVPAGSGPPASRSVNSSQSNNPTLQNKISAPQQQFWLKHVLN